jgi:hypothetical protein
MTAWGSVGSIDARIRPDRRPPRATRLRFAATHERMRRSHSRKEKK